METVLERRALKNPHQRTSQRVRWTSGWTGGRRQRDAFEFSAFGNVDSSTEELLAHK